MSLGLSTDWLEFHLNPSEGTWSVWPHDGRGPRASGIRMSAAWRAARRERRWQGKLASARDEEEGTLATSLGAARWLRLHLDAGEGVELDLEWAAVLRSPLLLCRASLSNRSTEPIEAGDIELIRIWGGPSGETRGAAHPGHASGLDWGAGPPDLAFYSNGWQSWNLTGTLSPSDPFPRTRLGPLTSPMRVNAGTPHPRGRGCFSADLYGVLGSRKSRHGLLAGFLSQRQTFGGLETRLDREDGRLRLWACGDLSRLDPGASLTTDWAVIQFVDLDSPDPLGPYLDAAARENSARNAGVLPVGWCSWYYYFEDLSEKDVRANLAWASLHRDGAPLSLIQIDDGFEAEVGDWFEANARFAGGLPALRNEIHRAGFRPGLWLAPFVAKPGARVVAEHPDWVLQAPHGGPANAGFIWNTWTRALDVTHPGVLAQTDRLIRTARHEWGFDYLKLDFLYAGALPGRRQDPTKTRAQALHHALSTIRDAAGTDAYLVGCGCPLGSGVGIFDAMRISADVAPRWAPAFRGIEAFFRAEPDFPSARNAIHNVITRSHLHRRWWVNDPDCVLLREKGPPRGREAGRLPPKASRQHLTEAEVQSLATVVSLSAGSLIVSDDLPSLSPARSLWLRRLLPALPRAARVLDWFDSFRPCRLVLPLSGAAGQWSLVALINWRDRMEDLTLDLGLAGLEAPVHHAVDFWQGAYRRVEGRSLEVHGIPPHGVALLALRPADSVPCWAGDTLHVSQGLILDAWDPHRTGLSADLAPGHRAQGIAFLALPGHPTGASLDGAPVGWAAVGEEVYAFDLTVGPRASFRVSWE